MSRLRVYTVHINPSLSHPYEVAEFIEEGFSWTAFIFTFIWAFYKKLWWLALLIIAFDICMLNLLDSSALTDKGIAVIQLAAQVLIGLFANDMLRAKYKRKGYIIADIVTGDSLMRAEQRFFDRYFQMQNQAPFVA